MSQVFAFVIIIACLKNITTYTVSGNFVSRPKNELYDAFMRFLELSPSLKGYNFTKRDEKEFLLGSQREDVYMDVEEIAAKYGYPMERYEVTTEDGYVVVLFRLRRLGPPVFLMHGLLLSSDEWITAGVDSGLAYLLADEGYDVWMGNARGTKHSLRHESLEPGSAAFWNFSWDEIGRYDLPAMIDFVLYTTSHDRLVYVGHSQGTTTFFVLTSERPEYNDKVSVMIALAPAAGIPNLKSPLLQFVNYATLLHVEILFAEIRRNGRNTVGPDFLNSFLRIFTTVFCKKSVISKVLCSSLMFFLAGFNYSQLNFYQLPVVLSHLTSDVAMKQIEHYAQTVTYQTFQQFDYGREENEIRYGSVEPPFYDIGSITTPIWLFYSSADWLASDTDTKILWSKLPNANLYRIPDDKFSHLDFVLARDLRSLVFRPMLDVIKHSEL